MDLLQLQGVFLASKLSVPLLQTQSSVCNDSATSFSPTSDCYKTPPPGTIGECLYCNALTSPPRQLCVMIPNTAGFTAAGCGFIGNTGEMSRHAHERPDVVSMPPGLSMVPIAPYLDARLNTASVKSHDGSESAGVRHLYYIAPGLLAVNPCHDAHCLIIPTLSRWMCRTFLTNSAGASWKMVCNKTIEYSPNAMPPGDQLVGRELEFDHHGRDHIHIHISMGSNGQCFNNLNHYCFVSECPGPGHPSSPTPNCWGDTNNTAKDVITTYDNHLAIEHNISISEDNVAYPHANTEDVILRNDVLATFGKYFVMFTQGHNSNTRFDSTAINSWRQSATLRGTDPVSGDTLANPPVRSKGSDSEPIIKIKLTSWKTGIVFPARLTLESYSVVLRFTGQSYISGNDRYSRVAANYSLLVYTRIELLPDDPDWPAHPIWDDDPALRPFRFKSPTNPFNYSIDDPGDILIPSGPGGCRVPLRVDWRGIRGPSPFALGPYNFVPGTRAVHACYALYSGLGGTAKSARKFIFHEINNQESTPAVPLPPQRYLGDVATWRNF